MVATYTPFPKISYSAIQALLLSFVLMLALRVNASEPTQMIPLSLEQRVQKADLVLEGEVISQQSFWDAAHKNIYTSNIIRVYKIFKGEVQAQEVELITRGGTVGLHKHVSSSALQLEPGQQGVFFLKTDQPIRDTPGGKHLSTRAYGSQQGLVKYNLKRGDAQDVYNTYNSVEEVYKAVTSKTGKTYRTVTENQRLRTARQNKLQQFKKSGPSAAAPVILDFSPKRASAGTNTVLTITGTGFGNSRGSGFVEFKNADDGGESTIRPLATDYISWTNTVIKVYVPSTSEEGSPAGTGTVQVTASDGTTTTSTAILVIPFAYSNIKYKGKDQPESASKAYQPVLADRNNQGGYTIQFGPNLTTKTAAQAGFRNALNSWVCNSNVNWQIGSSTTVKDKGEDNINLIRFVPDAELGENVLASTQSYYAGCQNIANGKIGWRLQEFDMDINSEINWEYGPAAPQTRQFDFETVVLHELGHAHQLGHVILPNSAVMHFAIESKAMFRELSADDIEGARKVIANSLDPAAAEFATSCTPEKPAGAAKPYHAHSSNLCTAPEVASINASYQEGKALVNWKTQNEQPVDYYILQHSPDGINWQDLGTTFEPGQSPYSFTDTAPFPKSTYYRIKVVYNTGKTSFSDIEQAIEPEVAGTIVAYPNPVRTDDKTIKLRYFVKQSAEVTMHMYTTTGQLAGNYTLSFLENGIPAELDLSHLSPGVYILKWQEKSQSGEIRIVKL